jgi:hypothetical protein
MNEDLGHDRPPAVAERTRTHAAPTELGRASGVVVPIDMALLTELGQSLSPKMRVRCSDDRRTPVEPPEGSPDQTTRRRKLSLRRIRCGPYKQAHAEQVENRSGTGQRMLPTRGRCFPVGLAQGQPAASQTRI